MTYIKKLKEYGPYDIKQLGKLPCWFVDGRCGYNIPNEFSRTKEGAAKKAIQVIEEAKENGLQPIWLYEE